MFKELLNRPPAKTKLKSIEHPGFPVSDPISSFPGKMAIVDGKGGAYYGGVSRFCSTRPDNIACHTAFGVAEARHIVNSHNSKLEK